MNDFSFTVSDATVATTQETARRLHITEKKLRTIRQAGLIRFHRLGRVYTYTEQDIAEFISLTENVDLSSDEKIKAFGRKLKERTAGKQTRSNWV